MTSGELFAPSPARLISLRLGAVPDDGKRPHAWLRFLNQATGFDVELIDFLQKWIGYCLTGHTSEHVLAFIYGPGGTGKSTFANVVRELLGQYARHSPMDTFLVARGERHPTDLAGFAGARLVTAVETDEGRPWDEAKLKALTGDDPITARYMRRDFFTYRPRFKLLIAGNELPTLKSPDEAMRRRFRVVPFINRPPKPDRNLAAKLRYELPRHPHLGSRRYSPLVRQRTRRRRHRRTGNRRILHRLRPHRPVARRNLHLHPRRPAPTRISRDPLANVDSVVQDQRYRPRNTPPIRAATRQPRHPPRKDRWQNLPARHPTTQPHHPPTNSRPGPGPPMTTQRTFRTIRTFLPFGPARAYARASCVCARAHVKAIP